MLKGRGRDPRTASLATPPPAHLKIGCARPPAILRSPTPSMHRAAPTSRPEPDYEVVEFPGEQYVNAKLQPPPPPPPRPPTGMYRYCRYKQQESWAKSCNYLLIPSYS